MPDYLVDIDDHLLERARVASGEETNRGTVEVDTSVLMRSGQPDVAERLDDLRLEGKAWTCDMVDLEYLYSTKAREVPSAARKQENSPRAPVNPRTTARAIKIMKSLAAAGRHRHAKAADCVIAASAELAGLTVLHYDRDYDHISEITGIDTEWFAPPGSLDKPTPSMKAFPQ